MAVFEALTEEECYLVAILQDESGLDVAEFCWFDPERNDGCWRAWAFQVRWFRCTDPMQLDQCARSVGKSLSIKVRAFVFCFIHPNQEMVITAPEKVHLDAITDLIETQLVSTRLTREMLTGGRSSIKHQPFHVNFVNNSRIMGRIPQRDGKGVKGCAATGTPVLTDGGVVFVEDLRVGDLVLTHKGQFKPVLGIYEDVNDCYEVRGQSSSPLTVSCDHRFMGAANAAGPKQKRNLGETSFQDVEFLLEDSWYWASPTEFPTLPVPPVGVRLLDAPGMTDWWWLIGRYIADGYLSDSKGRPNKVHWCVHPKDEAEVTSRLDALGVSWWRTTRAHSSAIIISIGDKALGCWLEEHFGRRCAEKELPMFVLGMGATDQSALLLGYVSGDGHVSKSKNRIEVGTASKKLAIGLQFLAQSLGYTVNCCEVTPKTTHISDVALKRSPRPSFRLQLLTTGHPILRDGYLYSKVKSVTPVGKQTIYDIRVADDYSYITGSIMSHNIHPIWLEADEMQDYPKPGWDELIETLKRGFAGAVWRAHGVTRGVRDEFYKHSQPESDFQVHRYTAMSRPNWTDQERQEKIKLYGGSKDHPTYRRNILGLHGDLTNPLFVLHRLMKCVDDNDTSDYNQLEYQFTRLTDEMVADYGDIVGLLDFNAKHKNGRYLHHWIGMDVGFTVDPTELLVFGEYKPARKKDDDFEPKSRLRLLSRVHLERIRHDQQVRAVLWMIDFYKPRVFAMDSTGLGLPLYQDIQDRALDSARCIKGYNFSEKILVDFDQTVDVDEYTGDVVKEAGIKRNVREYAQDCLRDLVDEQRLELPWDLELISQFQGGTQQTRPTPDQYGRRRIMSAGDDHALDAARMAALGFRQYAIEEFLKGEAQEDVLDVFVSY